MAKDGTMRGNVAGNLTGGGRKKKPLADKISEGRTYGAKVLSVPDAETLGMEDFSDTEFSDVPDIEPADINGADMPAPDEYLNAQQKDGKPFHADRIYRETWQWLKERKCEKLVNKRTIEAYAQNFARYIQCEDAISTYGFIGKHPTTGGMTTSPFVAMSQTFQKQAQLLWFQIFQVVKENCSVPFADNPNDNFMEQLLSGRF